MQTDADPVRNLSMADVQAAQSGDREALTRLVRALQPRIHALALRFLGSPVDAEDAAQEALIQIVTKLDRFDGRSAFTTWAYRVATNKLLSITRARRDVVLDIEAFKEDLARAPVASFALPAGVEEGLMAQEIRIGCSLAMLLCLEPGQRMALILAEFMELDHVTGAEVLEISPAAFRKRVQRARHQIADLMRSRCGLFDPRNVCRCNKRIPMAMEEGRVDPRNLIFASSREQVREFPALLDEVRRLDEAERVGALYRLLPEPRPVADLAKYVHRLFSTRESTQS